MLTNIFFIIIFFSQLNLLLICKSLSHDRLLLLTQQMSTFLTLMNCDLLKEHIKMRKISEEIMERLKKSDYWEEIISRDSAGESQYRDISIIHILFQSQTLSKRKQSSEAVSWKKRAFKSYILSSRQWSGIIHFQVKRDNQCISLWYS